MNELREKLSKEIRIYFPALGVLGVCDRLMKRMKIRL